MFVLLREHFALHFREDPDVTLVGEMRDYETISAAVTAAETGHLAAVNTSYDRGS